MGPISDVANCWTDAAKGICARVLSQFWLIRILGYNKDIAYHVRKVLIFDTVSDTPPWNLRHLITFFYFSVLKNYDRLVFLTTPTAHINTKPFVMSQGGPHSYLRSVKTTPVKCYCLPNMRKVKRSITLHFSKQLFEHNMTSSDN